MNTDIKKLDKCQIKLTVTIEADDAKTIIKDVEKTFIREARLPGFRPGKAPIEVIRKNFADQIKQECERTMFNKFYVDAIKAEAIDEVALMNVENVSISSESGSFTAIVDVKPEFKIPTYKGLKVESKDVSVKEADVDEQINHIRVGNAKYEDGKDGDIVMDGDYVQIDYSGMVDKKPILEVAPEAKAVASGTGFWTMVEEGRFLSEILEAVKGMKAGETKGDIKVKFDKNAAPEALKGKKAVYEVTVKTMRHRILPSDEELVKKMSQESMDSLRKMIRETLEKQNIEAEAARRENEVVELLLKKSDFDVPQSQVRNATDNFLNQFAQRAQYSGLDASYFEQNRDKILKDAEDAAVRQVRLWYILDAIAKAEKIEAKDDKIGKSVIEFILANVKK